VRRLPTGDATLIVSTPPVATDDDDESDDDGDGDEGDDESFDHEGDDDGECPPLPLALAEAARRGGGLRMEWHVDVDGRRCRGVIALPDEQWLRENWSRTFMEGEPGFSVAPNSDDIEICWPAGQESSEVFFFDDDAVLIAESTLERAFGFMIDRLGLPDWADLRDGDDDEFGAEDDDDESADEGDTIDALADRVRAAIALPKTTIREWRERARSTTSAWPPLDLATTKRAAVLDAQRTILRLTCTTEELEAAWRAVERTGDKAWLRAVAVVLSETYLLPRPRTFVDDDGKSTDAKSTATKSRKKTATKNAAKSAKATTAGEGVDAIEGIDRAEFERKCRRAAELYKESL
jgi:hypothetical protein